MGPLFHEDLFFLLLRSDPFSRLSFSPQSQIFTLARLLSQENLDPNPMCPADEAESGITYKQCCYLLTYMEISPPACTYPSIALAYSHSHINQSTNQPANPSTRTWTRTHWAPRDECMYDQCGNIQTSRSCIASFCPYRSIASKQNVDPPSPLDCHPTPPESYKNPLSLLSFALPTTTYHFHIPRSRQTELPTSNQPSLFRFT
jgi:hypothetical protein